MARSSGLTFCSAGHGLPCLLLTHEPCPQPTCLPRGLPPGRGDEVVVEEKLAGEWLRISKEDALANGGAKGQDALMLRDGSALGLGLLLEEVLFRPLL